MAIVLVVEDDPSIADGLRRTLENEGYTVFVADDGQQGLDWLAHNIPNLIIADIMMPNMNGYQFFERVRQDPDKIHIPFLFLSAKGEPEDIRYAKEMGADDYLTKPIEPPDLLAAVRGRLHRFEQLEVSPSVAPEELEGTYRVGDARVDLSRRQVFIVEHEVALSMTEFGILQRLISAQGAVVSHEDLLDYDEEELLGEKDASHLLRYHIHNIRQKFKDAGATEDPIINVRGVGYRLADEPPYLA